MPWEYCTKQDVEDYTGFSQENLKDTWSEWAEGWLNERMGTSLTGSVEYTESIDGDGTDMVVLSNAPVVSVSSLSVDSVDLTTSEYKVYAAGYIRLVHSRGTSIKDALGDSKAAFPVGQQNVTVTYTAGTSTVPQNIRMAAALIVGQIALIREREGSEGSLSLSLARGQRAGEQDRVTQNLDSTGRIEAIADRLLVPRKSRFV